MQNIKHNYKRNTKDVPAASIGLLFLANKSLTDLPPFYTTIYIVDFFERTLHNSWYFAEKK